MLPVELTRASTDPRHAGDVKNIEARLNTQQEKEAPLCLPVGVCTVPSNVEAPDLRQHRSKVQHAKDHGTQKRVAQKLMEAPPVRCLRLARAMADRTATCRRTNKRRRSCVGWLSPAQRARQRSPNRRGHIVTNDDFSSIKSDEAADAFIKGAKDVCGLTAREREAAKTGADLTPETAARLKSATGSNPGRPSTGLACTRHGKGTARSSRRISGSWHRRSGGGGPKPKVQSKVAGVKLSGDGPFVAKDQKKADLANKFIGRAARAPRQRGMPDFGPLANTGVLPAGTPSSSVLKGRSGASEADFAEIRRAMDAGATLITDSPADRGRTYNYGNDRSRSSCKNGYRESSPGRWIRTQSAAATAARQRQAFAQ